MIWFSKNWLIVGAALSTIVTLALASFDKTSSATVTAGFTLALVVLQNFPLLDSLKGWGLEAKMRAEKVEKDLDKAEELLAQMDKIALTVSGASMGWVLYQGRFASPTWNEKVDLLNKVVDLYKGGDLSDNILRDIKKLKNLHQNWMMDRFARLVDKRAGVLGIHRHFEDRAHKEFSTDDEFKDEMFAAIEASGLSHEDKEKLRDHALVCLSDYKKMNALSNNVETDEYEDLLEIYYDVFGDKIERF